MKTNKHITTGFSFKRAMTTCLMALPFLATAQQATASSGSYFSNALFNTLLVVIILLAITIVALGNVLKTISMSGMLEQKFKAVKEAGSKNTGKILMVLFTLSGGGLFAQTAEKAADSSIGGIDQTTFYMMITIIAIEALAAGIMMYLIKTFLQNEEAVKAKKEETAAKPKESKILARLSGAVAVEKEETILMDHSYDGIRELDNDLPPWWKYGFYLTILIAVLYLINYHITKTAPLQAEEYKISVKKAEAEIAEFMKTSAGNVDETTVKMLTEVSDLATGKELYINNCAACHGKAGEGTVGPNLTDDYWLHEGGIKDIFKTIKYGWPDKGMKSWKEDFSPMQIAQLSSFIKSLGGTNPPNQKEKQGELYKEAAPSDSTIVKKDTVKTIAGR